MFASLKQLDWQTKSSKADLSAHWRVLCAIAICASLFACIWRFAFPNVFLFLVLWAGVTSGIALGAVIGGAWQLYLPARRARTSGRLLAGLLFAGGALALMAVVMVGPKLREQEAGRAAFLADSQKGIVAVEMTGRQTRTLVD